MTDPLIDISVHGLGPKNQNNIRKGEDQRRQKESDARSCLPLLERTIRDALALVHLGGVIGGLEGVAGGGEGLEVGAVLLVGL
jgi:hypothetical protein